ncbi:MAG: peptidylprolyl isomerase [Nitratireductor sp.]
MLYNNLISKLKASNTAIIALTLSVGVVSFAVLNANVPSAFAQDANAVVAKIGGVEITEKQLAFTQQEMAQQFEQVPEKDRRAAALSALIDIKVMALQAEKDGFSDNDEFKQRMEFLKARTLHNAYFEEVVTKSITKEAIQARYEQEIAATPGAEEINARHILVKTEEEAKAIIAEIEGGKDFVELAKEKSTGPSGPNGGDLGYFGKGQMVPEFEAAAFALEKGAVTKEPVKTQFGYHIIKKEDEREAPKPKLEDVSNQVRQVLLREKYLEAIETAKKSTPVEILDADLQTTIEANQ